jgi:catechol 2,3-dioxygenase-like lactoylglutathione lyase family enzyme
LAWIVGANGQSSVGSGSGQARAARATLSGFDERRTHAMQMKLELVVVPVSDVDRAKAFYTDQVGFNADHDYQVNENLRFVQLTPPGSACSIAIGTGLTTMSPGSMKGLQMVVADAQAAHDELASRGVAVSEVDVMPWGSFVFFSDPDGNGWSLQQLPPRP